MDQSADLEGTQAAAMASRQYHSPPRASGEAWRYHVGNIHGMTGSIRQSPSQVANTRATATATSTYPTSPTASSPWRNPVSTAHEAAVRKRPMPSPSEPDEPPSKIPKLENSSTEDPARIILGCPFYKRDPVKYRSCRRFVLTKISYVKQHVLRSHRMPPHCQICNRLFHTDEQQLEHVRSQTCERQPYSPPEGVTQAQIELLRGRVNQKKGLEGQWYETYEILFPGAQRPSSVYIDPELSYDLEEFTNFLTSQGPSILLENVPRLRLEEDFRSEISVALREIYDRWYKQKAGGSA